MKDDLDNIGKLLLRYIKTIINEYGVYIDSDIINHVLNNKIVTFSNSDTISFIVKKGVLYLPKHIYSLIPEFQKNIGYGVLPNDGRRIEDYMDTSTTYYDYINHFIRGGLSAYNYFEESLLHEAFHLCGCSGNHPLEEGITELKTRELAQKYSIKIAGYAYPKEVEVAKKVQDIMGKDIIDELAFVLDNKYDFLIGKVGIEKADLYLKVVKDMTDLSKGYYSKFEKISKPSDKAELYSQLDYSSVLKYLDEYIGKIR